MEDPESKTNLVSDDLISFAPLTLCSVVFRLKREKLALRELIKFAAAILCIQIICGVGISFMRPNVKNLPLGRSLPILATMPVCILYVFSYLNIITGPWGSENSRFWCDIRIMYVRGFNTIRTVLNMFSTSLMLIFLSILLGHSDSLSLSLIFLIGMISEWQNGTVENVNQYDVKVFDKFMDGDILCLETLHFSQMQTKREKVQWFSFIFSLVVKLYLATSILCTADMNHTSLTFGVPVAIAVIFYTCVIPSLGIFMFLKGAITFCQLELYRILMDIAFPILIISFSLV